MARMVPSGSQAVTHLFTRIKVFMSLALRIPHNCKLRLQSSRSVSSEVLIGAAGAPTATGEIEDRGTPH